MSAGTSMTSGAYRLKVTLNDVEPKVLRRPRKSGQFARTSWWWTQSFGTGLRPVEIPANREKNREFVKKWGSACDLALKFRFQNSRLRVNSLRKQNRELIRENRELRSNNRDRRRHFEVTDF
jgi:hypothetical protein